MQPKPILVFNTALMSDGTVRVGVEGQLSQERLGLLVVKALQLALNKMEEAAKEPTIGVPPREVADKLLVGRA